MKNRMSTLLFLSVLALGSCAPRTSESPSESAKPPVTTPSKEETTGSETQPAIDPFELAFAKLQSENISFASETYSVQTSLTNPNDTHINLFGTRDAFFEKGKYKLSAYQDGTLITELTYFEDEEGYAASKYLTLMNEVQVTRGPQPFKWAQSVYYNLFGDLTLDHFIEEDATTYTLDLTVPNFELWADYIATSLTGMREFSAESLTILLDGDQIEQIVIEEKTSSDPGSDYSYGRRIVARVMSVGDIEIQMTEPYSHDPLNDDLSTAITELQSATNYQTTLKAYPYTVNGFSDNFDFQEVTLIDESDVFTTVTNDKNQVSYRGYHTHDGGYGEFVGSQNELGEIALLEEKFVEGTVRDLLPQLHFSGDIFRFVKEDANGEKIYELRDASLTPVLKELTIGSYLDTYYGEVPITLTTKEGHLSSLSFDGAGLESFYKYTIEFSNINTTTIDPQVFLNYQTATKVTSYDDERLNFIFEDDLEGPFAGLTMGFGEFFEIALAGSVEVPFYTTFNPSSDEYYGGITNTGDGLICEISCIITDTSGLGEFIGSLYELGFEEGVDPTNNYEMLFTSGDLKIGITEPMEGDTIGFLGFLVPETNFLA